MPKFAVKEIIEGRLFAARTDSNGDVLVDCITNWQNPLYLNEYLKKYNNTQEFYGVGRKVATKLIIREAGTLIEKINKAGLDKTTLQPFDELLFVPLHDSDDFRIKHMAAKAYGASGIKSFLRIYAIRFSDGAYLIVGGLIKMHLKLQDSIEGRNILSIIKEWQNYLRKRSIDDAFDIVEILL